MAISLYSVYPHTQKDDVKNQKSDGNILWYYRMNAAVKGGCRELYLCPSLPSPSLTSFSIFSLYPLTPPFSLLPSFSPTSSSFLFSFLLSLFLPPFLHPLPQYARDTQHEKIQRGLALGISFVSSI